MIPCQAIDFMCGPKEAGHLRVAWERYLRESGYYDEEPLRTIKYRRMQRRAHLRWQQRLPAPKLP